MRMSQLSAAIALAMAFTATARSANAAPDTPADLSPDGAARTTIDSKVTPLGKVEVKATEHDFRADTSSIGGKVPTALRDIPQSITVIDRSLLEAQGATSFQDALRNVPGITIGGAEGGQIGNNINLRGFTARTDIYLDGFRDRGQYYRDTFNLDAIEVLKGPSSMLFGRGSTGGVINQTSKQPFVGTLDQITATIGTGERYRISGDFNHSISDTAAARVNVFGQDIHSDRDVMTSRDAGIAPTLRFGIGTPTEITLSALLQRNHDMPDYGLPPLNGQPAPVDRRNFYGLTDDRTNQDVDVVSVLVEYKFSDQFSLRNQVQYSHYTIDARETAPNTVVTADGITLNRTTGNYTTDPIESLLVQLASHDRDITDTSFYNQTDFVGKFSTGSVAHTLIAGAELGRDTYTNQSYSRSGLPLVSLIDPEYFTSSANIVTTATNRASGHADTYAVFANDTIKFDPHWQAVVGLRRDRYSAELTNTTSSPPSADQTIEFTSVRGGLIYQPTEAQSYYVSYGNSFNPSLEALTVSNGTQALPPEKNRSYEIGAKWNALGNTLDVTAALFQIEKTDARTQLSPGVYSLDGNVRVRGFELGATGRINEHWQLFGGYTRLNAEIVRALDGTQGNVPANTPRNSATIWTNFTITPEWDIGGGATYLSSRFANNSNTVSAGGYARIDATIAWHQPKYDVRLNLLNLTDRTYFDSLIPSDGGRAVPGIGRTALVSVNYRF
ncbi:MAG: TonB-dependent siderophore receptor [Dokdonella sp.]